MASSSVCPPGGDGRCGPRPPANSLQWAAEVLHTLRPLIYVLLRCDAACVPTLARGLATCSHPEGHAPRGGGILPSGPRHPAHACTPPPPLRSRARGRQAWSPWLLSLLTELASAQLSHAALAQRRREQDRDGAEPTRVEAQELSRRRSHFAYYFLREPLFALLTEPAAERAADTLGNVPLVGAGMRYLLAMLRYLQRYHFYTTASG